MDELLVYRLPQNVKDVSGERFGLLRAVAFSHIGKPPQRDRYWWFRYDCGRYKVMLLHPGYMNTCGCLRLARQRQAAKAMAVHGRANTKLYRVYGAMKERCYKPSSSAYKNYGGRGIRVCDEWRLDPHSFLLWADANGYIPGLQLDRRDNDGPYSPENCRWVTRKVNNNNRRNAVRLAHAGREQTLEEWATETGLSYSALKQRIKAGWAIEDVLFRSPGRRLPYRV